MNMKTALSTFLLMFVLTLSLSAQRVTDAHQIKQTIINHKYEDVNKQIESPNGYKSTPFVSFLGYYPVMDGEIALSSLIKPTPGTNGGICVISSTGRISVTGANGSSISFYLLTDGRLETTYNGEQIYLKQEK